MPRTNKYLTTTVLGYTEFNHQNHLILQNYSGFETLMPEALVKANGLIVEEDNKLVLTTGLYEKWFIENQEKKMNELSVILYRNFHSLYKNRELILNNKKYYQLSPKWLYSGGLYYGTLRYSLGSLIKEWDTNKRLKKENGLMYRISGSMLSGANQYDSLNMETERFEKGHIQRSNGSHWTNYLEIFKELSEQPKNNLSDNIKYATEVINTLNLH